MLCEREKKTKKTPKNKAENIINHEKFTEIPFVDTRFCCCFVIFKCKY